MKKFEDALKEVHSHSGKADDEDTAELKEAIDLQGFEETRHAELIREMIRRYGVNQFKLDGTGSSSKVVPGSVFGSDFEAAIALIADLRANPETLAFIKSELYLNEFLRALPTSLQFVPLGRQGQVTMGWVQARKEHRLDLFARRRMPEGFDASQRSQKWPAAR